MTPFIAGTWRDEGWGNVGIVQETLFGENLSS